MNYKVLQSLKKLLVVAVLAMATNAVAQNANFTTKPDARPAGSVPAEPAKKVKPAAAPKRTMAATPAVSPKKGAANTGTVNAQPSESTAAKPNTAANNAAVNNVKATLKPGTPATGNATKRATTKAKPANKPAGADALDNINKRLADPTVTGKEREDLLKRKAEITNRTK